MIIAHHIILTGYGHWLPNDPRGSISVELRNAALAPLGDIHYGRKAVQPSRGEIRSFYKDARGLLKYPVLWFNKVTTQTIGEAFGEVIRSEKLTCYACAVLRNHAHLVIRRHKIRHGRMIVLFRDASRKALVEAALAPQDHPVWSLDPFVAFKDTTAAVRSAIRYVEGNLTKHSMPPQPWGFLTPYDDWPFHKRRASG